MITNIVMAAMAFYCLTMGLTYLVAPHSFDKRWWRKWLLIVVATGALLLVLVGALGLDEKIQPFVEKFWRMLEWP